MTDRRSRLSGEMGSCFNCGTTILRLLLLLPPVILLAPTLSLRAHPSPLAAAGCRSFGL